MLNLNIEDFRNLIENKVEAKEPEEEKSNSISIEELKYMYEEKIKQLHQSYQKIIEEEKQKSFQEGYKKGQEEAQKELEERLKGEIQRALASRETEFQNLLNSTKKEISTFLNRLKGEYIKKVEFIDELILSALEEILYYMYIHPSNYEFLAKEIRKIILQVKNSSYIKLIISPSLKEFLKDIEIENLEIEIDEELPEGDFIIELEHVQLEANFKEKIKILKDEIKREIKKHSKI